MDKFEINIVNKHSHVKTEWDYYIGRGSKLGNPYTSKRNSKYPNVIIVNSKEEAIELYEKYLVEQLEDNEYDIYTAFAGMLLILHKYNKINLVCYCSPQPCHGNIIKKYLKQLL